MDGITMIYPAEIIKLLWDGEFAFHGDPQTEEEFKSAFMPVTGVDENDTNLFESDPNNLPISWEEYRSKRDEYLSQLPLKELRLKRNQLIAETDWTQNGDVPESVKDKFQPYRQALRDITETYSSLDEVVWPEKPE